jgi:hypothetical protein
MKWHDRCAVGSWYCWVSEIISHVHPAGLGFYSCSATDPVLSLYCPLTVLAQSGFVLVNSSTCLKSASQNRRDHAVVSLPSTVYLLLAWQPALAVCTDR